MSEVLFSSKHTQSQNPKLQSLLNSVSNMRYGAGGLSYCLEGFSTHKSIVLEFQHSISSISIFTAAREPREYLQKAAGEIGDLLEELQQLSERITVASFLLASHCLKVSQVRVIGNLQVEFALVAMWRSRDLYFATSDSQYLLRYLEASKGFREAMAKIKPIEHELLESIVSLETEIEVAAMLSGS